EAEMPLVGLQRAIAGEAREPARGEQRVGGEPARQLRGAEQRQARVEPARAARARKRARRQLEVEARREAVTMKLARGQRLAAFEQRGLVAQDDVAHRRSRAIDPECGAPFVAEGEVDLVPREPRALVVEGPDEAVPRLDGAVGVT